jgi:membrane protease YdiL (CAAX protease family)
MGSARMANESGGSGPLRAPAALVGFLALLIGFFAIGFATQGRSVIAGLWVTEALAIALPAIILVRCANVQFAPYLGLHPPRPKHLLVALAVGVANQPVVSLLTWGVRSLVPADWLDAFDLKQRALESIFAAQAVPFLATVMIAAPLGEELFFRGFAQPALQRSWGPVAAVLVSGAMFALIHLDRVGFLGLWEIGITLALLRYATGSLWPSILCHAVNNGIAGVSFLLGWEDPSTPPPPWLLVLGGLLLLGGIVAAASLLAQKRPPAPELPANPVEPATLRPLRAPLLEAIWVAAIVAGIGEITKTLPPLPMSAWEGLSAAAAVAVLASAVRTAPA